MAFFNVNPASDFGPLRKGSDIAGADMKPDKGSGRPRAADRPEGLGQTRARAADSSDISGLSELNRLMGSSSASSSDVEMPEQLGRRPKRKTKPPDRMKPTMSETLTAELSPSVEHFMAPEAAAAAPKKKQKKSGADEENGEKPSIKYVSAEDMARRNIERKYGAAALAGAEINLDDTSCEELEQQQIARQVRRDTATRRRLTCEERDARRNRRMARKAGWPGNGGLESASLEHVDANFMHDKTGVGEFSGEESDDSMSNYKRGDFYDRPLERSSASEKSLVCNSAERRLKRMRVPNSATAVGRVTQCFLCGWGRDEYAMVDNDHVKELFRILYSKPGTDMRIVALEAHKFYMTQIYRDAVLRHQELPVWRSRAIHICLTQHKKEPKIKLQIHLAQLDQKLDALDSMCFFESQDGTVHPHHKNLREYRDMLSMYWKLMEKDMTRMNFYQSELNIKFADSEYRAHSVRVMQHRATVNRLMH